MGKWAIRHGQPAISTFSIVGFDVQTKEIGVAVQSKFLAVGAAVPWVSADAGAIATQSWANTSYGPRGLAMLRDGMHPQAVLNALMESDENREERQVGIVDLQGRSATYTGSGCFHWAGGVTGPSFACQGNILVGEAVVSEMARAFGQTDGALPERLVAALAAGQAAGGDSRGMQSAALYIAKPNGGYGGFNDRYIDLRVDDHPTPIDELARILQLHRLYFERSRPEDLVPLGGEILAEVRDLLRKAGYDVGTGLNYDAQTIEALRTYYLTENFDERWTEKPVIDMRVLEFMRR